MPFKQCIMIIESRAFARAGLLGNPSDGFFGKTISIIVRNFSATVLLYESPELRIEEDEESCFRNLSHFTETIRRTGYYGGKRLVKAAIKKFCEYCEAQHIVLPVKNFTIRFNTTIPRQVGLSGSSAIITATFKALMQFYQVEISIEMLPTWVLKAESEELSITAGLQDRVIQAYEGCVYMNFEKSYMEKNGHGQYEVIDPALLPKFYIAYKTELSKVSGAVHNPIKARFEAGEPMVCDTLAEIAEVAEQGKKAILENNHERLNELINLNFDLRCKIYQIAPDNMSLVQTARSCGVSAKFAGSGGTIIGMYPDEESLHRLIVKMKDLNVRVIKPYIS